MRINRRKALTQRMFLAGLTTPDPAARMLTIGRSTVHVAATPMNVMAPSATGDQVLPHAAVRFTGCLDVPNARAGSPQ